MVTLPVDSRTPRAEVTTALRRKVLSYALYYNGRAFFISVYNTAALLNFMNKKIKNNFPALRLWFCFVTVISLFCGIVYVTGQQILRIGANDPQIQLAEDNANDLSNNQPAMIMGQTIDMAKSLASFVIIYDQNGNPQNSSAQLNGSTPTVPAGVFNSVRDNGEDRITWQPESGVRIAAVITSYQNSSGSGFVLAGRSLREVEAREDLLLMQVVAAWIVSLATMSVVLFLAKKI